MISATTNKVFLMLNTLDLVVLRIIPSHVWSRYAKTTVIFARLGKFFIKNSLMLGLNRPDF